MGNQKSASAVAKRCRSECNGTLAESPRGDEDQSEDEESLQPAHKSRRTGSPVEPTEADLNVTNSSPASQPNPKATKNPTAAAAKEKNKKAASDADTEKENSELELVHLKDNQWLTC